MDWLKPRRTWISFLFFVNLMVFLSWQVVKFRLLTSDSIHLDSISPHSISADSDGLDSLQSATANGIMGLEFMTKNFLVSWQSLKEGRYWTLWSSTFSHNSFLHFFLNMYILRSFGPIVEMLMGARRFIVFYLLAGGFSSLCHALISAFLLGEPQIRALGASGALSGVLMLFAFFYPRERIYIMGFIPVPALVGVLMLAGLDLWGLVEQAKGGGFPIGHGAHLGGAFFGFVYYVLVLSKKNKNHLIEGGI